MRTDRRKHYDDEFRREALELIKAGAGSKSLARRLATPKQTARKMDPAVQIQRRGGRVSGKSVRPAGVEVTRRERSAVVQRLAGLGHRLGHLLEIAGLARSTYFHHLSHPEHVTRPDLESPIREIWGRTANGCGHRQVRMCLVREFGRRVSAKTVLRVMRRMGLRCRIRAANPWRRYSSYRGDSGGRVPDLLKRDFTAERPFAKLGTDVTEFKVAGGKAYLAPVYDMGSKEIVAWDISRSPDLEQQKRLLAMLAERLPAGAAPILHSDSRARRLYIVHWNTERRRIRLGGAPRRSSGGVPPWPGIVS